MLSVRIRSLIQIFLLSLVIQGCAGSYSVVEFEVLEPATVNFPEHVNQLLFLNRAPITVDTWSEQNQVGMEPRQLVLLDTLIINNLFRGVQDVLRQSPIQTFHRPIWLSERRTDTTLLEDKVLTKREVMEICSDMRGDAIISLEMYTIGMDQHFDYYKDASDEVQNQYFEVFNSVKWNIHLPENPRPFDTYTTVDTLFFPAIIDGVFLDFSPGVDMIRELFYDSGSKYGSYLVPVWNRTSRILYRKGDDSLKVAIKHTDEGDWEHAFSIWDHLSKSGDSTLVAKSYHNMAVFFELEDKLDSASMMVNLSLEHDTLDPVSLYREELDIRLLNKKDIERQVRVR
ncbi:MAG: DUF6340 family protein [Bacteroidota bacterium]|nr:DUF6340 family protein [Bacteroidota bacterium]